MSIKLNPCWLVFCTSLLLSSLFLANVTLAVFFAGTIRSPLSTIYIVGIVIAGICLIAGTAGRWFYPK